MTALLLSIVDAGISQINRTHNAYGQLSNTPPTADNKNIQTNSGTPVIITLTGTDRFWKETNGSHAFFHSLDN